MVWAARSERARGQPRTPLQGSVLFQNPQFWTDKALCTQVDKVEVSELRRQHRTPSGKARATRRKPRRFLQVHFSKDEQPIDSMSFSMLRFSREDTST